jgi:hypothetical protein
LLPLLRGGRRRARWSSRRNMSLTDLCPRLLLWFLRLRRLRRRGGFLLASALWLAASALCERR